MVLWVYYALYLLPLYLISVFGTILLGISLHTYVPLWLVLSLGFGVKNAAAKDRQYLRSFSCGVAFPLLFAIFYVALWHFREQEMTYHNNQYLIEGNQELPRWVILSQQLQPDYLTERILKTDLVYQVPADGFSVWEMPENNFGEIKRHDPLVMLAVFLNGKPKLDRQEKVKLLESMYDARHHAEQRLWSGNNLNTSNVVTQVKIYPEYRLSYTEKILSVHNNLTSSRSQEEAIYTFYLPEGSVVTSLSLWINGQEEKGYLTTKGKAETAYNTIVGQERRDPSVVHWQEGNRVSVRVFPCTPDEDRQFKIGVTSPLKEDNEELIYENLYFSGPSAQGATESVALYLENQVQDLQLPSGYEQMKSSQYQRNGKYEQNWKLSFKKPALASSSFSFGGNSYKLAAQPEQMEPFSPAKVFLDVNASWSDAELDDVWKLVKHLPVYVWEGEMTQLTPENKDFVLQSLQKQNFSLFPFQKLKDAENTLVISKSTEASPNLSDLKNTPFANEMAEKLVLQTPVRVYTLGETLSPYLKSLRELKVIASMKGDNKQLATLLQQQRFIKALPENEVVRLGESGLTITKSSDKETVGNAPDHLMRLFAYNHILKQVGARYFCQDFQEEELIQEAEQANIVSPVSSLIVLETQADYERFDIQKSKDSLGNASIKSSGAVPEPAEWALIILAILTVAFITLKPYILR
ncbi:hypothetical protein GCM10028895_00520 [Pontibacter rugosus]